MTSPYKKSFSAELLARQKKGISPALKIILSLTAVIIVIAGYALYSRFSAKETTAPAKETLKSIAVLSFDDMSPEKDHEYFCDGIADAIINSLTHVKGLRVIARNSAFSFKGQHPDIREVGSKLDVETVMEGSVQKEGNRLRITAQLIKVSDGAHLWSERYDRDMESLFAIQDEISLAIVEALKVELLSGEKEAVVKRPTKNQEAYELYLLGKHHLSKRTKESREKAYGYFQQAIELDPDFALAYVGLARTGGDIEAFEKALEKALEIDKTCAEAHVSLARYSFFFDWDFPAAESGYKRAISLNPGLAEAHTSCATYLKAMGRFDEAFEEIERARELDPLLLGTYGEAISIYLLFDKYDEAMEQYNKVMEIDPENWYAKYHLERLCYSQGRYDEAVEIAQKRIPLQGVDPLLDIHLGIIYALSGQKDKAEMIIQEIKKRPEDTENPSIRIAYIYACMGENDKAFDWLDKAYENRELLMVFLKADFEWDKIRSDPRFDAMLKKMGLE